MLPNEIIIAAKVVHSSKEDLGLEKDFFVGGECTVLDADGHLIFDVVRASLDSKLRSGEFVNEIPILELPVLEKVDVDIVLFRRGNWGTAIRTVV
jgi:hypothetical protein